MARVPLSFGPAVVTVPVTTLWATAESPRAVDWAIVADPPDAVAWLAALDAEPAGATTGRLGLHGRIETQLVQGEPVIVLDVSQTGEWAQVAAPWQPSPKNPRGYPGWVRAAHLKPGPAAYELPPLGADPHTGSGEHPALPLAREHLGLRYLWGGLTTLGLDCSGLVHHAWRRLGFVVPRDAYAQAQAATPVAVDDVEPGDLYFFAHPGRGIHHVGIVVGPRRMVHASEVGGVLVEEELDADRLASLLAAGRLPLS